MSTPRSFIPLAALVLAAAVQPAPARETTLPAARALDAPHALIAHVPAARQEASLGAHILAALRHIIAGDDTIHRG